MKVRATIGAFELMKESVQRHADFCRKLIRLRIYIQIVDIVMCLVALFFLVVMFRLIYIVGGRYPGWFVLFGLYSLMAGKVIYDNFKDFLINRQEIRLRKSLLKNDINFLSFLEKNPPPEDVIIEMPDILQ